MVYVALLRGINVGGNNTIDMTALKVTFESVGMESVRTYINSGNVIFTSADPDSGALADTLERAIAERFGLAIGALVLSVGQMTAITASIPTDWANDDTQKCDVFYLWPDADRPSIIDELGAKPGIDDVLYVPGAVIRRVARIDATRSGLLRLFGNPVYRRMTIRNCNTARKLVALMAALEP
jgi:uncharacterized protein (DUF1697 family)